MEEIPLSSDQNHPTKIPEKPLERKCAWSKTKDHIMGVIFLLAAILTSFRLQRLFPVLLHDDEIMSLEEVGGMNNSAPELWTPPNKPAWLDFEMTPYDGPPDLQETLDLCAHQQGLCYSYICRGSGIGGQSLTLLTDMLYMRKVFNRTLVINDESHYRKYETAVDHVGFMPAYFTPRMAILETSEQRKWLDALMPGKLKYDDWEKTHLDFASPDVPLVVGRHPGQHNNLLRYYSAKNNLTAKDLYKDLVPLVCQNMQFNNATWSRIQALRQELSLPNYLQLPSTASVGNVTSRVGSIGFHIRRTDKVWAGRSPRFPASDYLNQARKLQRRDNISLTHCFVATDDYYAVTELQRSLTDDDGALCSHLHFTPPENTGNSRTSEEGALVFLMELSALKETNYFVGTFNSNVGDLVAALRACPNLPHDATEHYANSYGVDAEEWFYDP
eukprot:scaffold284_cov172-Amphora_coffeaeformis.AAC.1